MRRWVVLRGGVAAATVVAASIVTSPGGAEERPDLRRLFPQAADVFVPPPGGLSRVDLPAEVIAACRPDLSDLRLFARSGTEVPFLIDSGLAPDTRAAIRETLKATLLDVRREEQRRETGPALHREIYELAAPPHPSQSGAWDLVLAAQRGAFVRRVTVRVVQADGTTAPLIENGSLFRLSQPSREKTRLPLPPFAGERVTIALEGEDGFYLEPTFSFEGARTVEPRERIVVPLEEVGRERGDGRTIVRLVRPRGVVPDVLRLDTTTGSFDRTVEVWDASESGPARVLGRASLFRVEAAAPVEERDVRLDPARGDHLRVEILDGDSPTLEGLAFAAVVRQPALIFSLASLSQDNRPAGTLLFGGGRAYAPRYDLAGLMPAVDVALRGGRAAAAARLHDPTIAQARIGAIRSNPAFDATPVLAFAMRQGAEIDRRLYRWTRAIEVTPSPEGLSRLRLTPADVARARADLADLRIVDGASRQWPYLLARNAVSDWQDLKMEPPVQRRGTSRYELRLPVAPLELDQVALETDATFFDRSFRLLAAVDGNERTLTHGRLQRRAERQREVTIGFAPVRLEGLALTVEDGDDAALAFRSARGRVPLPELFLAAPAGEYTLLLGDADAKPPSYELERVRDVVLAVGSAPVRASDLTPNRLYSVRARLTSGERPQRVLPQILLWTVLIVAVAVLTIVTLRLARREDPVGDHDDAASGTPS